MPQSQCRHFPVTSRHAQLTFGVLVEHKATSKADEDGHQCAAGNIGRVASICLQCAPLQHAILVPDTSWIRPACSNASSQLVAPPLFASCCMVWERMHAQAGSRTNTDLVSIGCLGAIRFLVLGVYMRLFAGLQPHFSL